MEKWMRIIKECGMLDAKESEVHPHCPEEKAHLLHTFRQPGLGSEFEMMNFLHSVILLWKPSMILETGTSWGYTTLALAAACEFNGVGRVVTLDVEGRRQQHAKATAKKYGLDHLIEYVCEDSLKWTKNYDGDPFDFILFDTMLPIRWQEYQNMLNNGKISGVFCTHDTSRLRGNTYHEFSPELIANMDADTVPKRGLESKLGRGLRIFQI